MDNNSYSDFEKELVNNFDKYKFDASQFKEGFSNFETFAPFGTYEHLESQPQDVNSNSLLLGDTETNNNQTVDEVPAVDSGTTLDSANVSSNETDQEPDSEPAQPSEPPVQPSEPPAQPLPQESVSSLSQDVVVNEESEEEEENTDNEIDEESGTELVNEIVGESNEDEDFFTKYKFFIIIILVALVVALSSSNDF